MIDILVHDDNQSIDRRFYNTLRCMLLREQILISFFFWSPSSALVVLNESLFGYTTAYIITSKSHPQLLYEVELDSQGLMCV